MALRWRMTGHPTVGHPAGSRCGAGAAPPTESADRRGRGRLITKAVWAGLTLQLALIGGCGNSGGRPEGKVPPLVPVDYAQVAKAEREAKRLFDDDGQLLASKDKVAGILLPKGLKQTHKFEHEWYYRSPASLEQLRSYFGPRLLTGKVKRAGMGTVTYVDAQPLDTKKKAYVTVRIGPAPGRDRSKEAQVYISETPMMPTTRPTELQVRRELAEKMKYAH